MTAWHPARWPLRTRVALAFLASTAVAFAVLGVLVHVRVEAALEDRLRETVAVEADRLGALRGPALTAAVTALGGEVQAQVLTSRGDVVASSPMIDAPLPGPGAAGVTLADTDRWYEATAIVLDDDASAAGVDAPPERERFVLLARPTDDGVLVVGASREDIDEALAAVRAQLVVASLLALVVAGGLGYVVAGAGLRPIERLRTHAATISTRSSGERLPVPAADDELRRLAVTLNAMLDRLDDGLRRERRFIAEASHDLRTPLSLMLTEVELALAQPRTPEELTAALGSLQDEVRRLISLAEELLSRAGAEDVGAAIEARPVDLVAVAAGVADRFRAAAGDRAIRVDAPGAVEILGDASRLDRVISNLVDNALRHGAGDVGIEVRVSGDRAVLTVSDDGPRAPSREASDHPVAGLGLTIVGDIVRAHGGTVDVQHHGQRTDVRVEFSARSV